MGWSRAGRTLSVLLAGVLLLSAATAGLVVGGSTADGAASDGAAAPARTAESPALLQGFEADRTAFVITVYGNGSAEWRFRYERALNGSERDDFETFAEEFNDNETELFTNFRTRARWLTDNGSQATGREMRATGFARDARVEGLAPQTQALGVVELSFRWEGFARPTDDGDVEAGDVFEGGLYVGPDQELAFAAGPNLAFVRAQPTEGRVLSGDSLAESDTVTWTGERSFTDQRPRVVLADAESVDDAGATSADDDDDDGRGLLLPMGVLLVVVALGGGAAVAYRSGALPPGGGAAAGAETDAGDGGTGAGAGAGAGAAADAAETSPAVGVSEAELLSDEERVIDLLEDRGGRMKQVDIVEVTDWSKSKVSMLLSDMEEDEQISRLRVGRENIVSLAGNEPDAAGSPFDDEE
ncbi:hypothetical protein BRD02_12195 [Halobacteriales archaeon QS_8_69_73]|nr:MAG: hypothetical protein BRD02_12195 [Halobacteriales archaeon QS_8_69_73]